ncbi:MAG TPA: DciA family protein [Accumulibacter sp.]|uniref:DciA family protein n=1 Tax=Accumulibacter sp. TaxID=2053492 RepID=UPI0025DC03DE|nr:DciA family protein [Accumulibacter sp.]MCM8599667.1 DUF721 domain-containing protein [Accumulibacter sp.]MCM8663326.1 DUF721 domain-containing protein [Accumulibacter sp.]HNC50700.1 DciA family protein [Accumulibacter sp.]
MADSLDHFLAGPSGAGSVLAHARLLLALATRYQEIVPAHLGQASRMANYKSGVAVIHADSAAIAAKLGQMAPTMVRELKKRGIDCSAVRIKVCARQERKVTGRGTQKPLSAGASHDLMALSESLPASPLRAALEKLLACSPRRE